MKFLVVGLGDALLGLFLDREPQLDTEPAIGAPHVRRKKDFLLNQGVSFRAGDIVGGSDLPFKVRKGQACSVSLRQRDAVVLNVVARFSDDLLDGVSGAGRRSVVSTYF